MLVSLQEMLQEVEKKNFTIASINTPSQISLRAVIQAAEDTNMLVTTNHARTEEDVALTEIAVPLMLEYTRKSTAPISVHVDHGYDFNHCVRAVRLGYVSVVHDNSRFSLKENVEGTRRFVDIVHPLGIDIGAELSVMPDNMPGEMHGQETSGLSDLSVYFTNPDEAEIFCRESGCDVFMISFGAVHGMYTGEPNLGIELVKKIRAKAGNVTLGMYGGSGTPFNQIQAAIDAGIRKTNYFTAIDTAPAPYLAETVSETTSPISFCHLANQAVEIIYEKTVGTLAVFKNRKKF